MDTNLQTSVVAEQPINKGFALNKGDTAFAFFAVIASIFTVIYGVFGKFAFGYLLSLVFMLIVFTAYFAKGAKLSFMTILSGLLSFANGAVFIITSNGSVRFFAFVISFLLSLTYLGGLALGKAKGNRQSVGVFYSAISTMGNIGISLKSLFASRNGGKKTFGKTLLGIVCALPVLLIVVPLLIKSDAAFEGMVNSLFSNTFSTFLKVNIGLALALFVIAYGFSLKFGKVAKIGKPKFKGMENVYIISFLSSIAFCYLLYLFSQLAYFFSAFKGFLPEGDITYAEYARKGFFEMCAIAVINLIIVFVSLLLAKKPKGKVGFGVKAVATFISLFTLIIIATAISKMVLYIDAYGMTVKRLTTSAFMVFLGLVFISLAFKVYCRKINIIKTALATAGIIVLLLGVFNVNTICAEYNYQAYANGKLETIDIDALYELGDEGVPYLTKFAYAKDTELAEQAQGHLAEIYCDEYFENIYSTQGFTLDDLKANQKDSEFYRFSLPRIKAYDALYSFIEKNPDFDDKCKSYYNDISEFSPDSYDIYSDTSNFHSDYPDDTYF